MSTTKKLSNITPAQISGKGVQALADRPNTSQQYGASGLSPAQLKLRFDKLATFIADKINELQNTLSADDAAAYIRLLLDEQGIENFDDLVKSFLDGTFAAKVLHVFYGASRSEKDSLQNVIDFIMMDMSEANECISHLLENCAFYLNITRNPQGTEIEINLLNENGDELSSERIDLMVCTDKIAEDAVTYTKIAEDAVCKRHIQNGAVSADKLDPTLYERFLRVEEFALLPKAEEASF